MLTEKGKFIVCVCDPTLVNKNFSFWTHFDMFELEEKVVNIVFPRKVTEEGGK